MSEWSGRERVKGCRVHRARGNLTQATTRIQRDGASGLDLRPRRGVGYLPGPPPQLALQHPHLLAIIPNAPPSTPSPSSER